MGKIIIPENLKGKELTTFLVENKSALINQKKSAIKKTDPVGCIPALYILNGKEAKKAAPEDIAATLEQRNSVHVKVVMNTALWMDSAWDVLLPDCWKASINSRKALIPHLHDHVHEIGAEVGDVTDIYSQNVSLTDLGINKKGKTQCLIFETDIQRDYNEKVFMKYAGGKIKQHSIALNYVKLEIAINDEESEKEYDYWQKYYDQLINPELADETGFFFVVPEIKLLEGSAVLFGCNELTPVLDVKADSPVVPVTTDAPPFNLMDAIKKTKFFN